MATTRLDRLILLLDTGSSAATRKVAAEQVGEIVKLHPQDLQKLLCRLHTMLRSSNPHTRTAVGQAIGALAKNVPKVHYCPHMLVNSLGAELTRVCHSGTLLMHKMTRLWRMLLSSSPWQRLIWKVFLSMARSCWDPAAFNTS